MISILHRFNVPLPARYRGPVPGQIWNKELRPLEFDNRGCPSRIIAARTGPAGVARDGLEGEVNSNAHCGRGRGWGTGDEMRLGSYQRSCFCRRCRDNFSESSNIPITVRWSSSPGKRPETGTKTEPSFCRESAGGLARLGRPSLPVFRDERLQCIGRIPSPALRQRDAGGGDP